VNEHSAHSLAEFASMWEVFAPAIIAASISGAVLGALGVYVVIRKMIFLAAALSQSAGLGVAIALLFGKIAGVEHADALPMAGALTSVSLAGLPFFGRRGRTQRDALLGLLFIVGGAGALAIASRIHENEKIHGLLFGSAVLVLPEQMRMIIVVGVIVMALHIWWMRGFVQTSLDPDGARVRGLPVLLLELSLLATLVTMIAVATQALGALPVFAFSVLPAVAAMRIARTVPRAFILASIFGAAAGFGGYLLAYVLDLPVGASQALTAAAIVLASAVPDRLSAVIRPRQS
jgi:zinc transport system permease protein